MLNKSKIGRTKIRTLLITGAAILVTLVFFIAVFGLISYFFIPRCCHDYLQCDINMSNIWFALEEYAEDNQGNYPSQLEDLHPRYIDLTEINCPMSVKSKNSMETGYAYIRNINKKDLPAPILYCKHYHLNGHGPDTYCSQFNVLTQAGAIIHIRNRDLKKYDGPMRRYKYFRQYPYDGSVPTEEIVRHLKQKFPMEFGRFWIDY